MNKPVSYANVLHRLSLGKAVSGAELLTLPGFPRMRPIGPADKFVVGDLPELFAYVLTLTAMLNDEDEHEMLRQACEINECLASDAMRGQALPKHIRGLLWELATQVDLASNLSEV